MKNRTSPKKSPTRIGHVQNATRRYPVQSMREITRRQGQIATGMLKTN